MTVIFSVLTALFSATVALAQEAQDSGVYSRQITELRKRSAAGDPEANYRLGLLHLFGDLLAKDPAAARRHLSAAAEKGDPRAQNLMGLASDPLWGFSRDHNAQSSAKWYARAASQGYRAAQHNLNELVRTGHVSEESVPAVASALTQASLAEGAGPLAVSSGRENGIRPQDIFKSVAPAIVEIKNPRNYGSGVIIGTLVNTPQRSTWVTDTDSQALELPTRGLPVPISQEGHSYFLIATNAHVVSGATHLRIGLGVKGEGESAAFLPAVQVCRSTVPQEDLAFVLVDKRTVPADLRERLGSVPFHSVESPLEKGTEVFAIGNPEGLSRSIAKGLYNGQRPEGLQFDAPISVGSSGGALVTDKARLLGLTMGFSANAETQNLNFALPVQNIVQNLKLGQSNCVALSSVESQS